MKNKCSNCALCSFHYTTQNVRCDADHHVIKNECEEGCDDKFVEIEVEDGEENNMDYDCLCLCNKCGATLIDRNPMCTAKMLPLQGNEQNMILIEDKDEKFWGCPNCRTDEYLMDLPIIFDI